MVTLALIFPVLLAVLGFALDFGVLYYTKRTSQIAADGGAIGGVYEIKRDNRSRITGSARQSAQLNGFTTSNAQITVNSPPTQGIRAGDNRFVEVFVRRDVPTYFMRLFQPGPVTIRSRAVAGLASSANCVYVLNPSETKALEVSSGSTLNTSCGVIVNSNDPEAIHVSSCDSGEGLYAETISVAGDYYTDGCSVSPSPNIGADPESDPLGYISPPAASGPCDYTDYMLSNDTATLNPGVYCGGISIESNSTATLNPGTYIVRGQGFNVTSSSTVTGDGVTIYNTYDATYPYEGILIASNSVADLSAPTTGPLAGILFFQDRTADPTKENGIESNTAVSLEGALYFPTQHLRLHSDSDSLEAPAYTLIVVDTLEVSSNSLANAPDNYSSLFPTGSPIKGQGTLME